MKNILIVYNTMCIGGSTTSLLSILNHLDYNRYNVDLMLSDNSGELVNMIPKKVNILPQAYPDNLKQLKRYSIISNFKYIYGKMISYNKKNHKNIMGQIMTYENARFSRKINKKYDLAISFLENFPLNYVSKNVDANRKIAWIHLDYLDAGFIPKLDNKCYSNFDKFVLVSDECLNSFKKAFPQYKNKAVVIENILLANTIKQLSNEKVNFKIDKNYINLITVCRITFAHKGLDRVVNAFIKLKKEKVQHNLRWYIIGEGSDLEILKSMVLENELTDCIIILGKKTNPFPYEAYMDGFLLPSRYEGKPMAITEAQMLGIPPIVTKYSSAQEQINHMVDGIIVDNNDDEIFYILKEILKKPQLLLKLKENLLNNNYDNLYEMDKIIKMIEGENNE